MRNADREKKKQKKERVKVGEDLISGGEERRGKERKGKESKAKQSQAKQNRGKDKANIKKTNTNETSNFDKWISGTLTERRRALVDDIL